MLYVCGCRWRVYVHICRLRGGPMSHMRGTRGCVQHKAYPPAHQAERAGEPQALVGPPPVSLLPQPGILNSKGSGGSLALTHPRHAVAPRML